MPKTSAAPDTVSACARLRPEQHPSSHHGRANIRPVKSLHLSGNGSEALTITSDEEPEPLYWRVELQTDGLNAATDIDLDAIRRRVGPIDEFFATLAADWRGWEGERSWGQPPITLTATHDGLGHIRVTVGLEEFYDRWRVRGELVLDAGHFDQVARDAAGLPTLLPDG
jgi:Family of unknown function (DUF6228)